MINELSNRPSIRLRHGSVPLLEEREQYIQHLEQRGRSRIAIRLNVAFLVHIVQVMQLTVIRQVSLEEIQLAGKSWLSYAGADRRGPRSPATDTFVRIAKQWFTFHAVLERSPEAPFAEQLREYTKAMSTVQGLAPSTVRAYRTKLATFLKWLGSRHRVLETVALSDVHDFLALGRAAGHRPAFVASQCQALRSFFRYAEIAGWCRTGLPLCIRSPRLARYEGPPRGPAWAEVRKLIHSSGRSEPKDLRARAILLLFVIYGLRRSEVAQIELRDLDWFNETLLVRRAKRGGVQYFPLQYEVGEAIIEYLKHGRPPCASRHLFVSFRPPHHAFGLDGLWRLVSEKIDQAGIKLERRGPHCLRHTCATRLLERGSSLQEIADFLGHRSIDAVGIYARSDTRLLRKVATFSLAGVR